MGFPKRQWRVKITNSDKKFLLRIYIPKVFLKRALTWRKNKGEIIIVKKQDRTLTILNGRSLVVI